jgi:multidrug resistance efflux pump
MPEYSGHVSAEIYLLRFSESGRLKEINCAPSNLVKKGDLLAAIDPTPVQTQLDIELADYRRIRSEFDQLTRQLPIPKTEDEKTKKEIAQSRLDVSVKTVEKYKLTLDSLNLHAPFDAVIISTEGLAPGVNITPSGFPIIVADTKTAVFAVSLPESDFYSLSPGQSGQISLKNGFRFDSTISFLAPQSEKGYSHFTVHFRLPPLDLSNFRLGTTGTVTI